MSLEAIKRAWALLPRFEQAVIAGIAIFLVIWAVVAGTGWVKEHRSASAYSKVAAEEQAKRVTLEADRDTLRLQAAQLRAQAMVLEDQVKAKDELINQAGAKVQAADKKVDDAIAQYNQDVATVDDPVALAARRARLCDRLAALGHPCSSAPAPGQ